LRIDDACHGASLLSFPRLMLERHEGLRGGKKKKQSALALLIEIRTEPARREKTWPRRATREDTRRI
jgi:hypothetical protein